MPQPKANRRVEAIRQFRHARKPIGIGSVLELPLNIAVSLVQSGKAKFAPDAELRVNHELMHPLDIQERDAEIAKRAAKKEAAEERQRQRDEEADREARRKRGTNGDGEKKPEKKPEKKTDEK